MQQQGEGEGESKKSEEVQQRLIEERRKGREKLIKNLQRAADNESSAAQFDLGVRYMNGNIVKSDPEKAFDLFQLAAKQGHVKALTALAECYEHGIGVLQDRQKALEFYRLASTKQDPTAQYNLGVYYQNGEIIEEDLGEALKLYRLAAAQGKAFAQNALGECYENGIGVEQDLRKAIAWYRLALRGDCSKAHVNLDRLQCGVTIRGSDEEETAEELDILGAFSQYGIGVEKDLKKAAKLYGLAADQKYAPAQVNLGMCFQYGIGVEKDLKKAVKLYCLAADQNYASAQVNLGMCFQYGIGVERDLKKAVEFYRLAADQGNKEAKKRFKKLEMLVAPQESKSAVSVEPVVIEEESVQQAGSELLPSPSRSVLSHFSRRPLSPLGVTSASGLSSQISDLILSSSSISMGQSPSSSSNS